MRRAIRARPPPAAVRGGRRCAGRRVTRRAPRGERPGRARARMGPAANALARPPGIRRRALAPAQLLPRNVLEAVHLGPLCVRRRPRGSATGAAARTHLDARARPPGEASGSQIARALENREILSGADDRALLSLAPDVPEGVGRAGGFGATATATACSGLAWSSRTGFRLTSRSTARRPRRSASSSAAARCPRSAPRFAETGLPTGRPRPSGGSLRPGWSTFVPQPRSARQHRFYTLLSRCDEVVTRACGRSDVSRYSPRSG